MSAGAREEAVTAERRTSIKTSIPGQSLPMPKIPGQPSPIPEPLPGAPADASGSQHGPGEHPPHPLRAAMEARDPDAALRTLAWDVEMFSPVTPRPFVGREEVGHLLRLLIESFEELHYHDELHGEGTCTVAFHGRVLGRELHGLELLRMDEQDLVRRIEIGARPPAGVYALAARAAPRFARWRRDPVRAAILQAGLRPLPAAASVLDRMGSRLSRLPR